MLNMLKNVVVALLETLLLLRCGNAAVEKSAEICCCAEELLQRQKTLQTGPKLLEKC